MARRKFGSALGPGLVSSAQLYSWSMELLRRTNLLAPALAVRLVGSYDLGVTINTRLVFSLMASLLLKKKLITGISPRTGILVLLVVLVSP